MNLPANVTDDDLSNAARTMGRKGGHARAMKRSPAELSAYGLKGRAATCVCATCGRYFKRTVKRQRRCERCRNTKARSA